MHKFDDCAKIQISTFTNNVFILSETRCKINTDFYLRKIQIEAFIIKN